MPKRKSKRMRGGGLWDSFKNVLKGSKLISTILKEIPVVGNVAGTALNNLTGYGRPPPFHAGYPIRMQRGGGMRRGRTVIKA
jgi:hypothetical protein